MPLFLLPSNQNFLEFRSATVMDDPSHFPSTTTAHAAAVPLPIFDGEERCGPSHHSPSLKQGPSFDE
jgi:hypothetical protein